MYANEFVKIQSSLSLSFSPVIDGVEFTKHPVNLVLASESRAATPITGPSSYLLADEFSNRVPILLGSNKNEGNLFNKSVSTLFPSPSVAIADKRVRLPRDAGFDVATALLERTTGPEWAAKIIAEVSDNSPETASLPVTTIMFMFVLCPP